MPDFVFEPKHSKPELALKEAFLKAMCKVIASGEDAKSYAYPRGRMSLVWDWYYAQDKEDYLDIVGDCNRPLGNPSFVRKDKNGRLFAFGRKEKVWPDFIISYKNAPFVVEYDGAYWHRFKRGLDAHKTKILIANRYKVIRVYEKGLCPLALYVCDSDRNLFQFEVNPANVNWDALVNQIYSVLDRVVDFTSVENRLEG